MISKSVVFPLARIKRLLKMDEDIKHISKDALTLICNATVFNIILKELFVKDLANASQRNTHIHGRKTVNVFI